LKKNEILVILGKGDEEFQEINDKILPLSDKEIVLEVNLA
jgi:UDP-N-acetylmuramyl tripeptide synthase